MTSQNELTDSTLIITVVSKSTALVFSSYMTLLILKYGHRMELTQEACLRVEQEGISFREAQCIVELDLFLDEYPQWDLGTPHWPVILHEMFLHATARGLKEAECMCRQGHWGSVREPDPENASDSLATNRVSHFVEGTKGCIP